MLKLIEAFPDLVVWEIDASGAVRSWPEAAERLFGFSADQVRAAPPEQAPGVVRGAELAHAAENGRMESFGWAVKADGGRLWLNEVVMPLTDAKGRTDGFTRIVRDLTAWKLDDEGQARLFSLSSDVMCVASSEGRFVRVNPSFTRILGIPETELTRRNYVDFVHPDDLQATQVETASLNAGGRTVSFQNRYRHVDGTYRWFDWKAISVVSDQLIYAVARDVTDQKRAEQKLAEYAKDLERSNGDLQQFAYVASHDLQEPLRAIAGCLQMVAERNTGNLDERSIELMGHAIEGAKRLQKLINDLLHYSRLGSKGPARVWLDPQVQVDSALRQLESAVSESGSVVSIDRLPTTYADPVQLLQLFQNLLSNAIKFRGDSSPKIRVSARHDNSEVIFSVADNGIGIAPQYQEKVFGVFQRLNRRRDFEGTGIGLAIVKKIVDRHGGRIWIESTEGNGATFWFTIPDEIKP